MYAPASLQNDLIVRELLEFANEKFLEICACLDNDEAKLKDLPWKDKRDFLGFFEEVALMVNSRLIRLPVAHYMFGYYALLCWRSEKFWGDLERGSIYWALFRDFAERLAEEEQRFRFRRGSLRL